MPIDRGLVPFGSALRADVVALHHGLTSVLGLVERGLAEEEPTVESLQTALQLAKGEILSTLFVVKEAQAVIPNVGGFDGEPKIEWSDEV